MVDSPNRVVHDEEHKSPIGLFYNTWYPSTVDTSRLDRAYNNSMSKFTIIFGNEEMDVYRILHHLYKKFNLREKDFKTIDGLAVESYLDPSYKYIFNYNQIKDMVTTGVLSDINGRWLVIPSMCSLWTPRLAYLFYNELKEAGALGIIFSSHGEQNFGKVLVEDTLLSVCQFKDIVYTSKKYLEDNNS